MFRRHINLGLTFLSLIITVCGCTSIEVKNGSVDKNVAEKMSPYLGRYQSILSRQTIGGDVNQIMDSNLEIRLEVQNNMVVLKPSKDLVSAECHTKIGNLTRIDLPENDQLVVARGSFKLDLTSCQSRFNEPELKFVLSRNGDVGYLDVFVESKPSKWKQVFNFHSQGKKEIAKD